MLVSDGLPLQLHTRKKRKKDGHVSGLIYNDNIKYQ